MKNKIKKVRQGITAYEDFPSKDNCSIGFEGNSSDGYAHILPEDIEAKDVDLSSFKLKDRLNPKFWKNNKLDSRIRLKLLDIADDFTDFLSVDWVKPDDIIMTGSLSSFNWSDFSDVDLHILYDFKKIDDRTDFVKEYFNSKKDLWNQKHSNIKIYGFPVEVYVQDTKEKHTANGIYSLEKNEWIKEPKKENISKEINKDKIKKDSAYYMNKIDKLIDRYCPDADDFKKREILDDLDDTFDDIKSLRKKGFENGENEMNDGNITFKVMRRNGYLDKISNIKGDIYDKINSLD